jgi:hypothetical protein
MKSMAQAVTKTQTKEEKPTTFWYTDKSIRYGLTWKATKSGKLYSVELSAVANYVDLANSEVQLGTFHFFIDEKVMAKLLLPSMKAMVERRLEFIAYPPQTKCPCGFTWHSRLHKSLIVQCPQCKATIKRSYYFR